MADETFGFCPAVFDEHGFVVGCFSEFGAGFTFVLLRNSANEKERGNEYECHGEYTDDEVSGCCGHCSNRLRSS